MPPREKERLALCPPTVRQRLGKLASCYTESDILTAHKLYCMRNSGSTTIHAARLVQTLMRPENTIAIGLQVAVIVDDKRLLPSLGLLSLIRRYGSVENHYAVISEQAARLYTYGRDVFRESVIELKQNTRCSNEPIIVLNPRREPLGFGRLQQRGRVLIRNLIDVGWYLRSGL